MCFITFAQKDSVLIAKKDGYDILQELELTIRRDKSESFFEFTKKVSLPTTISCKFTNYRTTVDPFLDKPNPLLDADINIPIALGGKRWYFRTRYGEWYNAVHVIPQFRVKIFSNSTEFGDVSQPVRTPSYLPRITYYGTPGSFIKRDKLIGFFGSVFHHSNGQDGPEFFEDNKPFNFWKKGRINTYNGNFGEQLAFEFGMVYSKEYKVFPLTHSRFYRLENQEKKLEKGGGRTIFSSSSEGFIKDFHRLSLETHPKSLTNQDLLSKNLYGRNRLNYNLSWAYVSFPIEYLKSKHIGTDEKYYKEISKKHKREIFRFAIDGTLVMDRKYNFLNDNLTLGKAPFKKRINLLGTFYRRVGGTANAALFVQGGYLGTDPYNIYFAQSSWNFRFGLSFLYFEYERD